MSSTTNDGMAEATALAHVEDGKALNPSTGAYAEDAKALGLPIGVYGESKYGECRSLTLQEQLLGADRADTPGPEKTEA
jgi:hypothetical protein